MDGRRVYGFLLDEILPFTEKQHTMMAVHSLPKTGTTGPLGSGGAVCAFTVAGETG